MCARTHTRARARNGTTALPACARLLRALRLGTYLQQHAPRQLRRVRRDEQRLARHRGDLHHGVVLRTRKKAPQRAPSRRWVATRPDSMSASVCRRRARAGGRLRARSAHCAERTGRPTGLRRKGLKGLTINSPKHRRMRCGAVRCIAACSKAHWCSRKGCAFALPSNRAREKGEEGRGGGKGSPASRRARGAAWAGTAREATRTSCRSAGTI